MTVIYDAIGGDVAINATVEEFYKRVLNDTELRAQFDGINLAKLKKHQVDFFTTALGGPGAYNGRSLAKAHTGLNITVDQFERVVDHLSATLVSLGVDFQTVQEIIKRVMPLQDDIVNH